MGSNTGADQIRQRVGQIRLHQRRIKGKTGGVAGHDILPRRITLMIQLLQ